MAIAHSEEVTVPETHDVRVCQVCILVDLEGVVRRDSTLRCERELGDDVGELFR